MHNPSQDGWAGDLKNTTWTITGCSGRKRSQWIDRKRVCGRKMYLATGHQLLLILNWHSIKIFCKLSFYLRHATLRPTLRGSYWGSCYSIFNFMCMFCRSLFVLLYFFFLPLCCLFFIDIWCLQFILWICYISHKYKQRTYTFISLFVL